MRELLHDTELHLSDRQDGLTERQRRSLDDIDAWLQTEKRDDGTDTWWRFFDAGVRDEHGAVWTVYNDVRHQETPEGWRVFYCPPHQEQFHYLHIDKALHTAIPDVMHTVQFDVGGEGNRHAGMHQNDILNLAFKGNQPPVLKFWSDKASMMPVAVESMGEKGNGNPIVALGARALEIERPAA